MRSGFFNDTDVYAEDFARFAAGILTNGVLAKTGSELLVSASEGMSVSVAPGYCWIEGHFGRADEAEEITVDTADGTYTRIDRVVARLDRSEGSVYLHIIKGTPAAIPTAPDVVRGSTYYDLGLATISIPAGTLEISSGMIIDTREDNRVCGGVFPQRSFAFIEGDPPYNPAVFPNRNLNEVFAEEIAQYSTVWEWIGNRFATKKLEDIYISDYFVFEWDNKTWHARLQDMYIPCGVDSLTAWGDFMCDELLDPMYIMGDPSASSPNAYNNGSANNVGYIPYPWLVSHVYFYLNSVSGVKYIGKTESGHPYTFATKDYSEQGVWYNFPQEAKNVIVDKRIGAPYKIPGSTSGNYNNDNSLLHATNIANINLGKLWIPTLDELLGTSAGGSHALHPTFVYYANSNYSSWGTYYGILLSFKEKRREWLGKKDPSFLTKMKGNNDSLRFWLLDPDNNSVDKWDTLAISADGMSQVNEMKANNSYYVPLCFRIGVPTT